MYKKKAGLTQNLPVLKILGLKNTLHHATQDQEVKRLNL